MSVNKKPSRPCADKTRYNIIKAAQKLFVKKGFAATSISEIAHRAKINQSLIYHHFKDKKELWIKAKNQIICEHWELHPVKTLDELSQQSLSVFIENIVKQRFLLYLKNPDIVRIISWQRLEPNYGELYYCNSPYASLEGWCKAIQTLQDRGEIRKELSPGWIVIFMTNTIVGLFIDHGALCYKSKKIINEEYIPMITTSLYRALRQE